MPAEFDRMRLAIKRQLKKDNPGMSDDEAESRSFAIATTQWKKTHDGRGPSEDTNSENLGTEKSSEDDEGKIDEEEKFDEKGRLIVAENVKFQIDGSINTIEE